MSGVLNKIVGFGLVAVGAGLLWLLSEGEKEREEQPTRQAYCNYGDNEDEDDSKAWQKPVSRQQREEKILPGPLRESRELQRWPL